MLNYKTQEFEAERPIFCTHKLLHAGWRYEILKAIPRDMNTPSMVIFLRASTSEIVIFIGSNCNSIVTYITYGFVAFATFFSIIVFFQILNFHWLSHGLRIQSAVSINILIKYWKYGNRIDYTRYLFVDRYRVCPSPASVRMNSTMAVLRRSLLLSKTMGLLCS